jgi:squalene-hopene/tetraprenyl-beta-curcumene cyclase
MKTSRHLLGFVFWLAILGLSLATAAETSPRKTDAVKAAITKSLPYLETAGQDWIEKKKCITCHRITFMTWGYREALRHGFTVDAAKLQERLDWSVDSTIKPDPNLPPACVKNADGIGQLLFGHSSAGVASLSAEQSTRLVGALLKVQKSDGSWKPEGQLPGQKRPLEETTQVSTTWNIVGLAHVPPTDEITAARKKALDWLATAQPGKSTEWYAAQLVLRVQEKNEDKVTGLVAELKKQQQADGGWGWLTADPSDALGTGQAVYALLVAGVKADDETIKKARQFLCSTQQENGSWPVKGTKQNKKDKIEETATYWGTAWANVALLKTLPEPAAQAAK